MEALVGSTLLTKSGPKPTAEALGGAEVVGLYFSAHWCPPCKQFTPKLGTFYEKVKATKSFEIVFVSSDKDEGAFAEYYGEMAAWTALPFAEREVKAKLSKKFKVQGIPTFVLVDGATGEVLTADGRDGVSSDPEGADFPWRTPTLAETLGEVKTVTTQSKTEVAFATLAKKPVLIYFSAHWCPPCRGFTPDLVKFYDKLEAKYPEGVAIVFVSSDKDEASFADYFGSMGKTWFALPFAERGLKEKLSKAFDVGGIPTLVLLSATDETTGAREVVTKSGRGCVASDLVDDFPESWAPQPYGDLAQTVECSGSDINETTALLVLADGLEEPDADKAVGALKQVAVEDKAARAKGADPSTLFFFARKAAGPVGQVRSLCKAPATPDKVTVIKLDIPDNGGFYVAAPDVALTVEGLKAFLANPGERKQLQS